MCYRYFDGCNTSTCRSRPSSEGDDSLNSSSGGGGRRLSKHLERKEKFHGPPPSAPPPPPSQERPLSGSVPSGPPTEPTHPSGVMTLSTFLGTSGVAPGGEISGAGGGGGKGGRGGRKESGSSQHEHKRRKEDESGGSVDTRERSGSTASSSSGSRKRKRDLVDDEPPAIEAKKFRTSEQHHLPSSIAKDGERSMRTSREGGGAVGGASGGGVGGGVEGAEARSSGDRKRHHDTSSAKEGPPRKQYLRSRSPEKPRAGVTPSASGTTATAGSGSSSSSRRHGSSSRTVTSPTSKRGEHHHRSSKGASSSSSLKKTEAASGGGGGGGSATTTAGHESSGENDSLAATSSTSLTGVTLAGDTVTPSAESVRKKLDWASVSSYTRKASTKLEKRPTTALERFTPGAVFARVGVSPSLAGKGYFDAISSHVSRHLRKAYQQKTVGEQGGGGGAGSNMLPKSLLDSPFEGQQFASSCVSRIKDQLEWEHVVVDNVGPCRRALTASADYTIRRKLKKSNQVRVIG